MPGKMAYFNHLYPEITVFIQQYETNDIVPVYMGVLLFFVLMVASSLWIAVGPFVFSA